MCLCCMHVVWCVVCMLYKSVGVVCVLYVCCKMCCIGVVFYLPWLSLIFLSRLFDTIYLFIQFFWFAGIITTSQSSDVCHNFATLVHNWIMIAWELLNPTSNHGDLSISLIDAQSNNHQKFCHQRRCLFWPISHLPYAVSPKSEWYLFSNICMITIRMPRALIELHFTHIKKAFSCFT